MATFTFSDVTFCGWDSIVMGVNLELYHRRRQNQTDLEGPLRQLCQVCLRAQKACYCQALRPIDVPMTFVILMHPIEFRRGIATGRMAHLSLQRSHLVVGQDFTADAKVARLLGEPRYRPLLLYPGVRSTDLSTLTGEQRRAAYSDGRELLIFVVDGTWATARKTMRLSHNLRALEQVAFTPTTESRFHVRKQPRVDCLSTIEAIHHTIELLGDSQGFAVNERIHDALLNPFHSMVNRQLVFVPRHS
jgi:DTW domain-containing protein YfiP